MKICIVTNRFARDEGQGRVNYEIAKYAAVQGYRVTCVAHHVGNDLLQYPTVQWVRVPDANKPIALLGNIAFLLRTARWLRRFGHRYDVVLTNGANTAYPADINVVHFVQSAWREAATAIPDAHEGFRGLYQWLYTSLGALLERYIVSKARIICAVSAKVQDELIHVGMPPSRIRVVHNGVDINEFHPGIASRTALELPEGVPLGLFAGDLKTRRKNLDSTLRALQRVDDVHLAVAGDTTDSPFPDMAQRIGIADRVHFMGFRRDIPDLMRAADFFVFPSRYEACTLVLLEAMASGLPIITAKTAGGAELVDTESGYVLDDPEDVKGISQAMRTLAKDSEKRQMMAHQARSTAETLTWEHMAKQYMTLIHEVEVAKNGQGTGRGDV